MRVPCKAERYTLLLFAQHELNQLSSTRESRGQETERFVLKIVILDPSTMIEEDGMYFNSTSKTPASRPVFQHRCL